MARKIVTKDALQVVFGDPQARTIKRLSRSVVAINALAPKYKAMKKSELREQTVVLKKRISGKKAETLDAILPDAFALVREASERVLGMRHFDVQLIGGIALHEGNVAEMKTGEGKTLVATLPSYLNALSGKGVHVVSVNDYLVQRDAGWMGELYDFLGLSTGVVIGDASFVWDADFDNSEHDDPRMRKLRPATRKEAYAADITYGTNNELGFDYLRDNMANEVDLLRQRELNYAIVDEVDSILIDEARTPLIISAPSEENPQAYGQFAQIAARLTPDDYTLDEKRRQVSLTDVGVEKIQRMLGIKNLYSPEHIRSVYHMDQALKAQTIFKRDKDYVVNNQGEVIIVDEFTGRLMIGRRYNEGLHQAIEAKEHVPVLTESRTLATISFQNYFRLYSKLSGMTGTAFTEAEEFQQVYGLDVIQIPSNRPSARKDNEDLIYKTEKAKIDAIVTTVKDNYDNGRPVLIGSSSIAKNELIAAGLSKAGIPHELLNAKNNEREASIVAHAGEKGAVTLATNIAGRGTDIVLGEGIQELGGLLVIGSERHESRRIDNQLRGRSGRQGDPGETQFYVSTEDDLMRIFQGERIASLMGRLGVDENTPIQARAISRTLETAQKRVEGYHYDGRKQVVQYDNVINRHRRVVYTIRRRILEGQDIRPEITKLIEARVRALTGLPIKNNPKFVDEFEAIFPMKREVVEKIGNEKRDKQRLDLASAAVDTFYRAKEKELTPDLMRRIEREIYLQVLDTLWMAHLENMQHLRDGIHWRSVGQRDPLVEYRSESQKLFDSLQDTLGDETLRAILHVRPQDITVQNTDDNHQTELTRAARSSVELGVNEITSPEQTSSSDFKKKAQPTAMTAKRDAAKKKRKTAAKSKSNARRKNR
jgi:preprotein translocase subunit SecA